MSSTAVCPRCGSPMQRRLDEFECSACGHFQNLRLSSGSISRSASSAKRPRVFESSAEELEAAARLPRANPRLTEALYLQRRLFLAAFLLLFFGVNYAAVSRGGNEILSSIITIRLAVATLVWTGLCAFVLYIDWTPLKKIALLLVLGALLWLGYDALTATAPGENMRQIAAVCSFLLLLWLGCILALDIRLHS